MSDANQNRYKRQKTQKRQEVKQNSSKRTLEDVTEEHLVPNKKSCGDLKESALQAVHIEHWRRADELVAALRSAFSQLQFSYNPTKPRRGAFEFVAVDIDGNESVIWSGLKRGPPRKEKFPEPEVLIGLFKDYFAKTQQN